MIATAAERTWVCGKARLTATEVARIACGVARDGDEPRVIIDLSAVSEVTTAAFARLILLRRDLRQRGRDLALRGLTGKPAALLAVLKLVKVLPQQPC